jgi:hypothetical protein
MPSQHPISVYLNPVLKDWVSERFAEAGYTSASEYVRALIIQDRLRHLFSGPSAEKPLTSTLSPPAGPDIPPDLDIGPA